MTNENWLNHDIAIEIIGRMIGDKVQEIRKLKLSKIVNSSDRENLENQVMEYHDELQRLYSSEDNEDILIKVKYEYAPYILEKYNEGNTYHHQLQT